LPPVGLFGQRSLVLSGFNHLVDDTTLFITPDFPESRTQMETGDRTNMALTSRACELKFKALVQEARLILDRPVGYRFFVTALAAPTLTLGPS
jgi:hypothetical protein